MKTFVDSNSNEEKDYQLKMYGKRAKEKILQLIGKEGIVIKNSFDHAINGTYTYQRVTNMDNKESSHTILVPTYTDLTDLEQSIYLAHELGHYYVYKNSRDFKVSFLNSDFNTAKYINEKLAWKKAKEVLESTKIIEQGGQGFQSRAFHDYIQIKNMCLRSYGNPLLSFASEIKRTAFWGVKLLISTYLFVALLFVFQNNNVPVPFIYELRLEDFNSYVVGFFWAMVFVYVLKKFSVFVFRILLINGER